jgi:hypothetical protein
MHECIAAEICRAYTYLHGFIVVCIAVDDGEALVEAGVAQSDHIADQLRHRDDHLQVNAREVLLLVEVKVAPHQQIHQAARLGATGSQLRVAASQNLRKTLHTILHTILVKDNLQHNRDGHTYWLHPGTKHVGTANENKR